MPIVSAADAALLRTSEINLERRHTGKDQVSKSLGNRHASSAASINEAFDWLLANGCSGTNLRHNSKCYNWHCYDHRMSSQEFSVMMPIIYICLTFPVSDFQYTGICDLVPSSIIQHLHVQDYGLQKCGYRTYTNNAQM